MGSLQNDLSEKLNSLEEKLFFRKKEEPE